jgi:hypothetical protein
MKVSELIKELKNYDGDLPVCIYEVDAHAVEITDVEKDADIFYEFTRIGHAKRKGKFLVLH